MKEIDELSDIYIQERFNRKMNKKHYNDPFIYAISDCIPISFDCQIAKMWIQNTIETSVYTPCTIQRTRQACPV